MIEAVPTPFQFLRHHGSSVAPACDFPLAIESFHDGFAIPPGLAGLFLATDQRGEGLVRKYCSERDWGAHQLASRLSQRLGLAGSFRALLARVVVDYQRFRGVSWDETDPLTRRAISPPVSKLLGADDAAALLHDFYDAVTLKRTTYLSKAIQGTGMRIESCGLILVSFHTYDPYDSRGNPRPEISLVFSAHGTSDSLANRVRHYDDLFPPELASQTAHEALIALMARNLETAGFSLGLNTPYALPAGSVELRTQAWLFYQHLRQAVEMAGAETLPDQWLLWPALLAVDYGEDWEDIFASNHVSGGGARVPLERARTAHANLKKFVARKGARVVKSYLRSSWRPSSIAIEVRKDLVLRGTWRVQRDCGWFDPGDRGLRDDMISRVAEILAETIRLFAERRRKK